MLAATLVPRLTDPLRRSIITYATSGVRTTVRCGTLSSSTFPCTSVTLRTAMGVARTPPLANTP